ncbi:MAG: isoaspartyl peptidase/L-asparaginase [Bacteroidales bacterium]|nr:isoaspartyl peptidase/L-asparaginase [Bacteroidales bacterium]
MKKFIAASVLALFLIIALIPFEGSGQHSAKKETKPDYVLVIHGGAGAMERSKMSAEAEEAYKSGLMAALEAGEKILKSGGSSTDAIVAAILLLEDNPLFNAGRGAVYNEAGKIAHDASIMEGAEGKAGAVGAIGIIRNPILAAKAIMDDGRHVFLIGVGAEDFAVKAGIDTVNPSYFFTQSRWDSYEKTRQTRLDREFPLNPKGTVGAVALDKNGNLAAGTSTGGMHYKRVGRLGDSPVIGAGTWADNKSCAISATGHGEYFIRNAVAHDIAARMLYGNQTLEQATDEVVMKNLKALDAGGGIIAVDKNGNIAMPFNTSGMFRGYVKAGEKANVAIYEDEN